MPPRSPIVCTGSSLARGAGHPSCGRDHWSDHLTLGPPDRDTGPVIQPVQRRSVPDDVFEQLAAEVVGGVLAPGAPLPSERKLAELLGVSRPAVREALQRLA